MGVGPPGWAGPRREVPGLRAAPPFGWPEAVRRRYKLPVMKSRSPSVKPVHRHLWLVEPLEREPTLWVKPMFGGKAVYLHGRFVLFLVDKAEPWRGVLVPMERDQHAAVMAERPVLRPHPVLPKWLYLPEADDSFETVAQWLVARIRVRDPRIGIVPPAAKRRRTRRDFNP